MPKKKVVGERGAPARGKAGVPVVDDATAVTPRAARPSRGDRGRRRVQEEPIVLGPSDLTIGDETGEQHAVAPRSHGGHGGVDPEAAVTQVEIPALPASAGLLAEPGASGAAPDDSAIDEVRAVQVVPDEPPPAPTRRVMARGRRPGRTDDLPDDLRDLEPTILDDDSVDDVSLDDPEDFLAGGASIEAGPDTGEHPAASGVGATGTEVAEVHDIPESDLEAVGGDDEPEAKLPTIVDLAFELKDRWKLAGDGYYYCYDRDAKEVYRIGVTEASRSESGEAVFEAQIAGGINNGTVTTVAVDALRDPARVQLFHPDKYTVGNARSIGMVDNISRSVGIALMQAQDRRTTSENLDRLFTTLRTWKEGYAAAVKDVSGIGERRWKELVSLCDAEASGVRGIASLLWHVEKGRKQSLFLDNEKTKQFLKDFENFFRVIQQAFGRYKSGGFDLAPLAGVRTVEQAAGTVDFNTIHREWKDLQQRARNISDLGAAGALYHSRYTDMVLHVMEMLRVLNDDRPRIEKLDDALREHGHNILMIIRMLFDAAKEYQGEGVARASAATPPRGLSAVTPMTPVESVAPVRPVVSTEAKTPPYGSRSVYGGPKFSPADFPVRTPDQAVSPVAEPSAAEQLEARWNAFVEAWPTAGGERYLITHTKGEPPGVPGVDGIADGPKQVLRLLPPDDPLYRPVSHDLVSFQDVTPPLKEGEFRPVVTLSKEEVIDSKERVNVLYDERLTADAFEGLRQRMDEFREDMRNFVIEGSVIRGTRSRLDFKLDTVYTESDEYPRKLAELQQLRDSIKDTLLQLDDVHLVPSQAMFMGVHWSTDFAEKLPMLFQNTDDIVEHAADVCDQLHQPDVAAAVRLITRVEELTRSLIRPMSQANVDLLFEEILKAQGNMIVVSPLDKRLQYILDVTMRIMADYLYVEEAKLRYCEPPNKRLSESLDQLSYTLRYHVIPVAASRVIAIAEAAKRTKLPASTPGTASAYLTPPRVAPVGVAPAPGMARRVTPYPGVAPVRVEHDDVSAEELRELLADRQDDPRPHVRPKDAHRPILSPEELDALREAVEKYPPDDEAEAWAGEDPAVPDLELDDEDDAQAETQPSVPAVVRPLDRRARHEARQRRRDTRGARAERLAQEPTWDAVLQPHTEMRNVSGTMRVQVVSVKGDTVTMFGQLSDGASAHLTYTRPSMIQWLERNGFSPRSVVEPAVTE